MTFDSDGAGIRAALRAIPILKEAGLTAKVIDMKPYKDPDDFIKALGVEAFQERIAQARNSFMFEIGVLEQNYNLKDPEEKTAFHNEIAKKLLDFEEDLERNNYIEAVAAKYQTGFENLRKLVNHMAIKNGITGERRPLKTGIHENKKKEDGMDKSQRLLLTWLIEEEKLFSIIKPYISPADFTEEIYKKTARILFEQYETGVVNPAKIVSMFTDEEQQREIASLFHTKISEIETKQDREKALKDTIVRIKQNSIAYRSRNLEPTDMAGLQKLVSDKQQLQEIQRLHISID